MELSAQRGAIPVELDRTRILFFDMAATGLLVDRYSMGFALALYYPVNDGRDIRLRSIDALAYFLWAGLQAEVRTAGDPLTVEQIGEFIRPWTVNALFTATYRALVGAIYTPPAEKPSGKAEADGAAAVPDADEAASETRKKKASTSLKRSGSRSASSAGRPSGSGG